METVVLVVHLLICIALVAVVMLQRSEGGALGIGGGSGSLMSGRGAANAIVRTTMILAAVFIVTSLTLSRLGAENAKTPDAVERELRAIEAGGIVAPTEPVDPLAPIDAAPAPTPSLTEGPAPQAVPPAAPAADPLAPQTAPAGVPAETPPAENR
ncbi:preprotein translocase subunit SecG [bacterium]|nr:preprotein translocase subunit SecG [bacterium]